jgi:hypothetical protein
MKTQEIHKLRAVNINKDGGNIIGEEEIDISDVIFDNLKGLYKFGIKEHGRCTGKVYVDNKDGEPLHIGYIFEKRCKYADVKETYLQETWLTIEHYRKSVMIERLPV